MGAVAHPSVTPYVRLSALNEFAGAVRDDHSAEAVLTEFHLLLAPETTASDVWGGKWIRSLVVVG